MSLFWKKCIICDGLGEIEITNRFIKVFGLKPKRVKCSMCQGKGNIPAHQTPFNPWGTDEK